MAAHTQIGKAYVQILPSVEGMSDRLRSAFDEQVPRGEGFGRRLGMAIKSGLALAAVGKFIKDAIGQGGELEQNLGGTEAVFGKFARNVQQTASAAYKNMGLSASEYMATANKMGSLFQGSGIAQQRSLELTSQAMQRAADVASVMGIDTTTALESIAGAAKGNFTMINYQSVA